jgi:hypothetical protein
MIHHPNLGNDFADQLSMTEKPNHRTLRDHNTYRLGDSAHVGGGDVTATESERHVHSRGRGIEVAARGKDGSFATDHEPESSCANSLIVPRRFEIGDVE